MPEDKKTGSSTARQPTPPPESQKERWLKYGSNVALTIVVVIVVAGLLTYLGQHWHYRGDTTASHSHSLSDATIQLIEKLPSKVKLVSLYTKVKRPDESGKSDAETALRYQEVADLLDEYQRKAGKNITVEVIDPYAEPAKVQQLFDEVSKTYGNNVNLYKDTLADFDKTVNEITDLIDKEAAAIKRVPSSNNQALELTMGLLRQTVDQFPDDLRDLQSTLPAELKKPNPDYKRAAEGARSKLGDLSRNLQGMIDGFKKQAEDLKPALAEFKQIVATQPATTQAASRPSQQREAIETIQTFLTYANESQPRYEKIKKLADDLVSRLRNLGELKQLDELREKKTDSIVVMGDKDMIVIPRDRVWREAAKGLREEASDKDKVRFAGEQQISTALVVLTSTSRPKVAFVRNGGPPVTIKIEHEEVGNYTGPYYTLAQTLREYNFDVIEKDLTDQWSQQAMQMQMRFPDLRLPTDATDEQLKDAVWFVRPGREQTPQMPGMPTPPSMPAQRLAAHLDGGGSALVLFGVQEDAMTTALAPWGVTAKPSYVVFHERAPEASGRVNDQVDEWRREQAFFVLNSYGDHPVTTPLQSLDSVWVPVVPIETNEVPDYTAKSLAQMTSGALQVWAKDIHRIRGRNITFDAASDMKAPLYGMAAVEKKKKTSKNEKGEEKETGGNRLVVIGGAEVASSQWMQIRERDVQRGGSTAPRFPGNSELVTNSVFWLAGLEKMMRIAPASRDTTLIAPISKVAMGFWRMTILGLVPLLVLGIGTFIYVSRRE